MKYQLRIQLADSPAGTIIEDDGSSWIFDGVDGSKVYIDHRGSISDGEMAMLLDSMRDQKLTTILEPLRAFKIIPIKADRDVHANFRRILSKEPIRV